MLYCPVLKGAGFAVRLDQSGDNAQSEQRRFSPMPRTYNAGVAQSVEQLICNQQVAGSSPIASLTTKQGDFPSGQREQTVNLPSSTSEVRILHPPVAETGFMDYHVQMTGTLQAGVAQW